MRIALVTDWFHPRIGGLELHLQDLGARLTAAGHDVVVITPTPGADRVAGLRVRRVNARLAPHFGFLATPSGVRALGDAIAGERVDVAHCHVSIVSPAGFGGAREAVRRGVPAVVTFHSIVPQTAVLAQAASAAFSTRRWRARFSAVSLRVARDVQPIAPGNVSILPNGIDAGFWHGVPAAPASDEVRVVSVMRLNSKKRPLALVALMQRLRESLPGVRVRLTVVGDGPQREALARAVARHGLSESVELLGWRSRDEIRALFAQSDLFVLPTVRESFGLAALEARCAGLPVVAMKASGVAELIMHG
ncbi:MAG: glycosyltransferase family 4 protein, partial [Solirubrobacteraceae bacterium]